MQYSNDTLDLALLRTNRNAFIMRCQAIIEIVVKKFIQSGLFQAEQLNDIIQAVNEELILRLPGVERNYNGKVLMTTYVNAVVRNICLDLRKKDQQSVQTIPLHDDDHGSDGDHIIQSLIVQDEYQRFLFVLTLFQPQHKLVLCMKLYFRMVLTASDIKNCFTEIPRNETVPLLKTFGDPNHQGLESEHFNALAPFMNRQEGNTTSGSSLRRWTHEQIDKIVTLLNKSSSERAHTKETVKILLEYYSQQQ